MKSYPIEGFPNYYVTDTGDVYSRTITNNWRIKKMRPQIMPSGYLKVNLCKNSIKTTKHVHRLVAEAFIPNPENKRQVNHKNGDRMDNRVSNLEWCSASENIKHSYDVLHRKNPRSMLGRKGKGNPRSIPVQQILNGVVVAEYENAVDAEDKTGICKTSIRNCCRGGAKTARGFEWKYKKRLAKKRDV
jgi:hypothetical protein